LRAVSFVDTPDCHLILGATGGFAGAVIFAVAGFETSTETKTV
jgi:hypothetical protein